MKITAHILLVVCVLTAGALGQSKQAASKIAAKYDEFALENRLNSEQDTRFKNFAARVKTYPTAKAVVIRYFARIQHSQQREPDFELQIIQQQLKDLKIPAWRIVAINGGIRDRDEVELWIVPSGALLPDSQPAYTASEVVTCPNDLRIGLYPYFILSRKPSVVFAANFYPAPPANVRYLWSVSDGEIIEGQGTATISLDVSRSKNTVVVVKVQVQGLRVECSNQASVSMHIVGSEPFLFEHAVRYNYSNLSAILDALIIGITETPDA